MLSITGTPAQALGFALERFPVNLGGIYASLAGRGLESVDVRPGSAERDHFERFLADLAVRPLEQGEILAAPLLVVVAGAQSLRYGGPVARTARP